MQRSILRDDRKPGISFILRCRNEEAYLAKSIESLKDLKVPYEIVVILHLCTDKSKQIAEKYKSEGYPIRIYEYNHEVSRAGYETLVTQGTHKASLVTFYNYCLSLAEYNWLCKWDADFEATKLLIDKFNQLDLDLKKPRRVYIYCLLGNVWHRESYLFNSLLHYKKYVFWEVPIYPEGIEIKYISKAFIKSIPIKITKSYWSHEPWFKKPDTYDAGLVAKYGLLEMVGGREGRGMARASNRSSHKPFYTVMRKKKLLKKAGIHITR